MFKLLAILLCSLSFSADAEQGNTVRHESNPHELIVCGWDEVYLFDRNSHVFSAHPLLKDKERVKSVSINSTTGQLAYTQAEGQNWWTEHIHFLNPSRTLSLPGERIYKVRWSH
jgi:hypothetical protein